MDLKRKQENMLLHDDEEEITKKKRAKRRVWVKLCLQINFEQGIYGNPSKNYLIQNQSNVI